MSITYFSSPYVIIKLTISDPLPAKVINECRSFLKNGTRNIQDMSRCLDCIYPWMSLPGKVPVKDRGRFIMIDKESGIPYYRQLMDMVQTQIDTGLLQEGQQIPAETEMSKLFQVNRHTVRQAINELCCLGILYKSRGRGTFVAKTPLNIIEYQFSAKNRFTENIKKMGGIPDTKVLRVIEMAAPDNIIEKLSLNPGDTVYCSYRQRFVNNSPFLVSQSYYPVKYFPNAFDYLHTIHSVAQFYKRYNIEYKRAKSTVRASFPSQEEAMMLGIPCNMPVLKVENLLKSQENILISYSVACYRGDLAKLSFAW